MSLFGCDQSRFNSACSISFKKRSSSFANFINSYKSSKYSLKVWRFLYLIIEIIIKTFILGIQNLLHIIYCNFHLIYQNCFHRQFYFESRIAGIIIIRGGGEKKEENLKTNFKFLNFRESIWKTFIIFIQSLNFIQLIFYLKWIGFKR